MTDRIAYKLAQEAQIRALAREDDPGWLTIKAYARFYAVDRGTVYKWLRSGLLTTFRVGRVVRVKHQPPKDSPPLDVDVC